ncbi:MAG: bifunctional metallophosphatase/5'-nucleotidase [Acidobacteria bacterium]|nr:bifunctional metallophosphatase/5'-nucleotidase [Acidobacteriota bacterium]
MLSVLYRVLAAICLIGAGLYAVPVTHVVIMHTNDIHGHLLPGQDAGGSAALATIVREVKPDLMLDAGDMFSGELISDTFQGQSVIEVMNAIGYDAVSIGNHEFNFGIEALRQRVEQANFPFLSANISSPVEAIHDAAIFNAQGIRIGVIGLTTEELPRAGHPKNVKWVEVRDVVTTLEKAIPRVREQSDFIVLLTHLTRAEEERVARAFPEIRLMVGGHEDEALHQPVRIGQTTIVRTGRFGKYVGRVDLSFNAAALAGMETQLIPLQNVEPDPSIVRLLEPYKEIVNERLHTVLGQASGDLTRSTASESHVGNLVADALRARTRTDITLINAASARVGIPKGPITERLLFEVLPFENRLITMKLSGAQIKKILGREVMSVSGVRVALDSKKPAGRRLKSVKLENGKPLRDKEYYSVTTNDFLLAGGDGFTEFAEGVEVEDTGILIRDAVAEHIARLGTVEPRLDGRIQVFR